MWPVAELSTMAKDPCENIEQGETLGTSDDLTDATVVKTVKVLFKWPFLGLFLTRLHLLLGFQDLHLVESSGIWQSKT